ncbi:MAG TPA: MoxR family ATPase, partial [Verrucomicrobiae bacterium]|nr:MoxR family ATPase [Verrucomicrobiae bacterium]
PLPEAQVDRFMLKLKIGYPSREEERQILELMAHTTSLPSAGAVVSAQQILEARRIINDIYIDDKVKDYIVDLVCATREPETYKIQVRDFIQLGASPRATISLTLAAKAYAFLKGRGYVTPQDVKSIGMDVLRHRVAITYEAEAENKTSETIIQKIFDELPVP